MAIFAPGWTWEAAGREGFEEREAKFWALLLPHLSTHGVLAGEGTGVRSSLAQLVFRSRFGLGRGPGWWDLGKQELQPGLLPPPAEGGANILDVEAGQVLQLQEKDRIVPLWLLHLDLTEQDAVIVVLEVEGGEVGVVLGLEGGVEEELERQEGEQEMMMRWGLQEEDKGIVFLSNSRQQRRVEKLGVRLEQGDEAQVKSIAVWRVPLEKV